MKPVWWAVAVVSIIGTVLNVLKCPWCFAIWSVTNLAWMVVHIRKRLYPQAALFGVYLVLAVWGLVAWIR